MSDGQRSIISLTTDFGVSDPYVGVMKGVILSKHRDVTIVDLGHGVPSQSVLAGAFVVKSHHQYFPAGTVHVVVVDPGVGTERPILAATAGGFTFLAPDNGILSQTLELYDDVAVHHVTNRDLFLDDVSRTFHGRDIFSPVAAALASGLPLAEVGPKVDDYQKLPLTPPIREGDALVGEILFVDGFGNLITNISNDVLSRYLEGRPAPRVHFKGIEIEGLTESYAAARRGQMIALIDSYDMLEIAMTSGNARNILQGRVGETVKVQ
ncbi:MAG: SAM-dependent chlorinase/fluorinase [Planctomycetota bacterium]